MTGPLPESGGGGGGGEGGICLSVTLQSSGHPRSEQIPAVSSSCELFTFSCLDISSSAQGLGEQF